MTTAYVRILFQQNPVVLGKLDTRTLETLTDNAIPNDLPRDWFKDNMFNVHSIIPVNPDTYAIRVVRKGPNDADGRPNLLSHIVVDDSPSFMVDPITPLHWLARIGAKSDMLTLEQLSEVVEHSRMLMNEGAWKTWVAMLRHSCTEAFLSEALSALSSQGIVYITYNELQELFQFLRLFFMVTRPSMRMYAAMDSDCPARFESSSAARIRCILVPKGSPTIEDGDSQFIKKQKASLIDLTDSSVRTSVKRRRIDELLVQEVLGPSLFGLPKFQHIMMLQYILKLRDLKKVSRDTKFDDLAGVSPALDDVLSSIRRLNDILGNLE